MWESLFATFEIEGPISYPRYAKNEIERYEKEIGFSLPNSYKDFCSTFGPGELVPSLQYSIAAPGLETLESFFEIRHLNGFVKGNMPKVDEYPGPPDLSGHAQLSRAIFFGSDISLHYYFWDPEEITSKADQEYAIYVVQRSYSIVRLADTFFEFVSRVCLATGAIGDAPDIERRRLFTPANVPPSIV